MSRTGGSYLRRHVDAARAAIAQGVPLKGYFVWSLFDNFEWHEGYAHRFGIVDVDFEWTQERRVRDSGRYWATLGRGAASRSRDDPGPRRSGAACPGRTPRRVGGGGLALRTEPDHPSRSAAAIQQHLQLGGGHLPRRLRRRVRVDDTVRT